MKSVHQSTMLKTSRWVIANDYTKSSPSTGTRIHTKRFSPTSPRGGFYSGAYDAARQVAAYYGYDPEEYVREQLGPKYHHRNWDWYKKNILGRKHYKHNASFPWLPRFPKKQYSSKYSNIKKVHSGYYTGKRVSGKNRPSYS